MGAADAGLPLQGVRVLVTRPAAQAQSLAQRIEQAGGEAIRFPTLEIAATRDVATLERVLVGIAYFDLAVFISPNAVAHGLAHLKMHGGLPARLTIAAIGRTPTRPRSARACAIMASTSSPSPASSACVICTTCWTPPRAYTCAGCRWWSWARARPRPVRRSAFKHSPGSHGTPVTT